MIHTRVETVAGQGGMTDKLILVDIGTLCTILNGRSIKTQTRNRPASVLSVVRMKGYKGNWQDHQVFL